jgi:2-dehydro-3-deoxyphosphogluconate aldolase / (4S)-4-hydroxy-2-oxoglutarate aldolase
MQRASNAERKIREDGIVAIIRGTYSSQDLLSMVEVLESAGVTCIELTLNSPDALSHLEWLRGRIGPNVLFGAGTVRSVADCESASDAGAAFLVAPGVDVASLEWARRAGVLLIPGVYTASEVQLARASGCRLQKLFPASTCGAGHLAALGGPFDDVGFMPVGGVTLADVPDYVRAGAVAFGIGSTLVSGTSQSRAQLAAAAAAFVEAITRARTAVVGPDVGA